MAYPKVTIMIPTYNQEEYIAEAIESALAQDYPNLEIVVTDDCSTDRTGEIAKSYEANYANLRYIRNTRNLGRVGNYHNTAHNIATGDWLVNLDGDDYFTSNVFIREAIDKILKYKDKNIVAYCYRHPNIKDIQDFITATTICDNAIIVDGKDYFLNYYKIGQFGHPNTIYRRDIGLKIGMYLLPCQACDFHSIMRIYLYGNLILDSRYVSHWRVHGRNTTIVESEDKMEQAKLTFDALQEYASSFFCNSELSYWRERMDKSAYDDFVFTYMWFHRNKKAWDLYISNFKPNRRNLRLLVRLLIGK